METDNEDPAKPQPANQLVDQPVDSIYSINSNTT